MSGHDCECGRPAVFVPKGQKKLRASNDHPLCRQCYMRARSRAQQFGLPQSRSRSALNSLSPLAFDTAGLRVLQAALMVLEVFERTQCSREEACG